MESGGCHGNHCRLDVKEEEEALDTRCHVTVAEAGGSCLQSVEATEVGYGDEVAMEETVQDSAILVGAGGTEEVRGDDDGVALMTAAAVDDEEAASASWRVVTTLRESQDHY